MQVLPRRRERIHAVPRLILSTRREVQLSNPDGIGVVRLAGGSAPVLLACDAPLRASDCGHSVVLTTPGGPATGDGPLTCFFRFPQQGQDLARIRSGLRNRERARLIRRAFIRWTCRRWPLCRTLRVSVRTRTYY